MFADGLTITFEGFLGLIVTVVGVWFVVQQLREAKLASQMESLLALSNQMTDLHAERIAIMEIANSKEWNEGGPDEVYAMVFDDKEIMDSYIKIGNLFDLIGTLVSSRALGMEMTNKLYGHLAPTMYRTLEKLINIDRHKENEPNIYDNWEWLTIELEKMNA